MKTDLFREEHNIRREEVLRRHLLLMDGSMNSLRLPLARKPKARRAASQQGAEEDEGPRLKEQVQPHGVEKEGVESGQALGHQSGLAFPVVGAP